MKKGLFLTGIGPLFTCGMMATDTIAFEPCEKTYVDPYNVDLEKNIIKEKDEEGVYQTSALYSDQNGIYLKNYLPEHQEIDETSTLVLTDELLDPFKQ